MWNAEREETTTPPQPPFTEAAAATCSEPPMANAPMPATDASVPANRPGPATCSPASKPPASSPSVAATRRSRTPCGRLRNVSTISKSLTPTQRPPEPGVYRLTNSVETLETLGQLNDSVFTEVSEYLVSAVLSGAVGGEPAEMFDRSVRFEPRNGLLLFCDVDPATRTVEMLSVELIVAAASN
ncbi:MAG: hypothetical protein S0880_36705 [Actinomycetota bacterium]|nr:hypothetical protein [Actinomycetota bacterium]